MKSLRLTLSVAFFVMFAVPVRAEVLSSHGDWDAVQELEDGKPVCFMSARPQKDEGDYTKRGDIFVIITHRPAEDRIGEVMVNAGYTYEPGSPVSLIIDRSKTFKLFTRESFAWTYGADEDKALIAAMRAGSSLVVKGKSSRGTQTTDTYSLSGFTAAYGAISKACGVR